MTLPRNVTDAVAYVDEVFDDCDNGEWQTIRAHLLSQEAEIADYKNASLHAADDCMTKDAEIARLQAHLDAGTEAGWHALRNERDALQSRLAAANAQLRLMHRVLSQAVCVAWLHDVLEDCADEFKNELLSGVPVHIFRAVHALTRWKGQSSRFYYNTVRGNPLALRVKLADIADNSDEARLALLDEETAARLRRKYAKAIRCLA